MDEKVKRSPFFYVGDKYKLVPQLKKLMPDDIDTYIEPFVGGGSSAMNAKANKYLLNDIDKNVIRLHHFLESYKNDRISLYKEMFECIEYYQLSCSLDYTKVIP
ncbi:MAG: DNA adenine methylase, partial [Erysipelotrichaceae bacterium]|nr:DNA adenine methylase [Erysipelotrichaceae bacterium]